MGIRLPKTRGMLRRQAAGWLVRLQSGRDPDVQRKFAKWRDSDARNAAAFDRVRRSYEQGGLLRHSPVLSSPRDALTTRKVQWRSAAAFAAAAAALLILVPAGVLLIRGGPPFGATDAVMLSTGIGEIRQVDLADGSKVTLDTATKVVVEIGRSGRSAHLRYGRARFEVAQSSIPFVISTGGAMIRTRQGVLDVERGAEDDRVEVLAGSADVRGSARNEAPPVALGAGQGAAVDSRGPERTAVAPPAADWTRGMLQFDGTPLSDAVAFANRYSARHVILVGDLGALRVTGAFRARDTMGLAKGLAEAFDLSLREKAGGELVLSRRASQAPSRKKRG